ncbi:hypothetical protein MSAN_00740300 [Mycena sanguinolenta]|uniref:Uncharacterized protein n=1 Tax=Mycena sanguinolenta TaxID=230812 RepID=A0A8H6Z8B0_9AGAR|nr:hypothetical protein MSAN_00740300 [Mycena sanguinolenta]
MVVTRKTPVAPVPTGSRTNSSQAIPRAAKPKSTSTLVEKETAQVPAKNAAAAASPKPHAKSKHKNRHHKKPIKSPSGWLDRLVYLCLSLLVLYSFITCPRDSTLSNPICRSLSQYRVHVLEPYVLPPIYRTLAHPSVAPYVEKAQEIERTTARALRPAYQRSAPYVVATKRAVWDRTVVPAFYMYVAPQYRKHVLPQWRKYAAPHIARVTPYVVQAQHSLEHAAFVLHKTYSRRVSPAISQAYAFTKPYVVKGYRTIRPHVVAFYVVTSDKLGAARRAYVDPHVIRMWEKVLELSGAGPVQSPTQQPPPVPEKEPEPTAATSEDSTTEQVASETSVEVTVTPVKASSSIAPSAEEEIPEPTTAASSSVAAVETSAEASSVVPAAEASSAVPAASPSVVEASSPETTPAAAEPEVPAAIIEELSAASIAMESAHGMESPVVEEILADVEASVSSTSSAAPTTTAAAETEPEPSTAVMEELSAASIAMESAHGMESPIVQEILADVESSVASSAIPTPISTDDAGPVVEEEEDDSDLLGFLDDIGLGDDFFGDVDDSSVDSDIPFDADEDLELTPAEIQRLKQQEAEEQAAAKVRYTAERRAELEARMAESLDVLKTLAKESNKRLRKTLVGLRKSAVSKLDDPRTEVGGAVTNVRKEGDKMLAGLEGYLKKETTKASKGGDPVERAERWDTVVKKVEEKLGESIQKAQGILHAFHAEEKAREVEDGMEIIKEVKTACSQHQANVGLDLSWLNDVTYLDWKVYHSLAHIGEKFQAEASEIQAGTHKQPPVDPFIKRMEERQAELGALVNEFVGQIHELRQQATKAFEPVQEPPAQTAPPAHDEPEDVEPEVQDSPKEPEVSILPVPPAPEPGVVDPAQVIIGKSAEQVKEAIRIAEEHQEL